MECWSSGVMNYETELRNKNRGYMKLIVWQKAMELFELVWTIVFTENKIDFKLRSQLADAAQSVSANISEGYGRRSLKEYIQFSAKPGKLQSRVSTTSTFCIMKSRTV